ncbi:MAG: hypothetical protein PF450_13050, partial [Bacteroidales bacterium]|nr:hypothetical protein [Bacteroidales bacterium]
AIRSLAGLYGVSSTNARLDYEDILLLTSPFVTLINQRHYISVLSVTETSVTYWDQNIGNGGQEVIISREEFEDNWQGNVTITDQNLSQLRAEQGADTIKVLTDVESKKLKGAFFWFLIPIFTAIFNAIAVVVTVAIEIITVVMGPLLTFIGNVAAGLVQAVVNIGNIFGAIGNAFMGAMGGGAAAGAGAGAAGAAGAAGSGGIISSLVTGLSNTVIQLGVGYGVSTGLEALGVDPMVSGLLSSIITGGAMGLMSGGGFAGLFKSALQYGAAYGVELLGQHLDLDPMITGILSTATAALMGAGISEMTDPNFSFMDSLKYISKNVARELVGYGVQYAGMELGVDPTVSYLAGMAIRSSLQMGFSAGGGDPGTWIDGAIAGLAQGVTSVGLNYLVDEYDLNPLIANMGFSAISTAINGTLRAFMPGGSGDIFKEIFDIYGKNALTFFGVNDPNDPNYLWQQASYITQIQDFTQIVKERGLEDALNTYATGFFNSNAVNSIVSTGYTLGAYFKQKLQAGEYTVKIKDGKEYAEVAIEDEQGNKAGDAYFGWIEETQGWDDFIGATEKDENGIDMYRWGDLYSDANGNVGYYGYSELYNQFGDLGIFQTIQDGYQKYVEVTDSDGNVLFVAEPTVEGGYNYYNDFGEYVDAKIKDVMNGDYDISFSYEDFYEYEKEIEFQTLDADTKQLLANFGVTDIDTLGTFNYILGNKDNMSTSGLVYMSYEFSDDIKTLLAEYPELFNDVLRACVKYSLENGDSISSVILDMTMLDYTMDEENQYNFDYASLSDMDDFFEDAVDKFM